VWPGYLHTQGGEGERREKEKEKERREGGHR
jgi:hypothetical protein